MANLNITKSMLTPLPPLPFSICSQVIPGLPHDIHLIFLKISILGKILAKLRMGSRVGKDKEDVLCPGITLSLERKIQHVYKLLMVQYKKLTASKGFKNHRKNFCHSRNCFRDFSIS